MLKGLSNFERDLWQRAGKILAGDLIEEQVVPVATASRPSVVAEDDTLTEEIEEAVTAHTPAPSLSAEGGKAPAEPVFPEPVEVKTDFPGFADVQKPSYLQKDEHHTLLSERAEQEPGAETSRELPSPSVTRHPGQQKRIGPGNASPATGPDITQPEAGGAPKPARPNPLPQQKRRITRLVELGESAHSVSGLSITRGGQELANAGNRGDNDDSSILPSVTVPPLPEMMDMATQSVLEKARREAEKQALESGPQAGGDLEINKDAGDGLADLPQLATPGTANPIEGGPDEDLTDPEDGHGDEDTSSSASPLGAGNEDASSFFRNAPWDQGSK